ncbi:MAG: hypothetical protein ACFE0P_07420 [Oceanicaulis sp.]
MAFLAPLPSRPQWYPTLRVKPERALGVNLVFSGLGLGLLALASIAFADTRSRAMLAAAGMLIGSIALGWIAVNAVPGRSLNEKPQDIRLFFGWWILGGGFIAMVAATLAAV